MKSESFEKIFKDSVGDESLNRLELARLHQMIQKSRTGQTRRSLLKQRFIVEKRDRNLEFKATNVVSLGIKQRASHPRNSLVRSTLASLFLVIVVLLALPIWINQPLIHKISEEMKLNHIKGYQSEFVGRDLTRITEGMTRLDFSAVWPAKMKSVNWTILGGRYCSVQGHIALQLKVKHPETGETSTLFQSVYPEKLKMNAQNAELIHDSGNYRIQLWREQGILMGLVRQQEELPDLLPDKQE